ncbi:MAG: hypothetical protein DWQ05_19755 [Calditrichaeota bacterium]|nr:MAG: hypothetical protein DWQ05_19755 [Calditrichota bacterium]
MGKKQFVFWLIFIGVFLLLTDTLLYFGLSVISKKKNIFYAQTQVDSGKISNWLDHNFDPKLGWKIHQANANNLGTRRNSDYETKPVYDIKTFGDSFTMGAEVSAENTYQAFVEEMTGWDCLNYGVGAYGTDQAYLSYKNTTVKSKYTVLGILSENIGRVVSVYPAWYMREWFPPKPRFIENGDSFKLLASSINEKEKATLLLDENFVASLKDTDYWPDYYENQLGAPAKLQWPALYTLFGHMPFFLSRAKIVLANKLNPSLQSEVEKYKYTHLYKPGSEALQILKFITDEFVRTAKARGEIPIVLLFSDQFSIDIYKKYGFKTYGTLVAHLEQKNIRFVDLGEVFAKDDYGHYFLYYNSHYSPAGNKKVARTLVDFIRHLEKKEQTKS